MLKNIKQKTYSLLRRSEKYTKTDMVYLTKGGSWLTAGNMVTAICSFLIALVFANLLPKETYGIYRYILSIASLLAIPTLAGINTAIVQAVSRGYEGSLVRGLKTKIRWGILAGLASIGLAGYYYLNDNIALTISFLIIAGFLPLMDSFEIYNSFLVGRKLFNTKAKYSSLVHIFSAAALMATLFLTKNLFLILLVYFISYTLFRSLFLTLTFKKFSPNKKEDSQTISYGKHLTLMNTVNVLASYLDRVLVFHYLGAIELAIYSFAITPPEQLKSFLKNLRFLTLPKFSTRTKEEIKKAIFQKMLKFALFIGMGIAIYIFLAPYFYKIFFPQYIDSVFYSQIFAISLITAISILPTTALQSQMAKKQLYQLNIYASLIQIILLFFFIYFYGLIGIILARIISRFINLSITFWLFKRI